MRGGAWLACLLSTSACLTVTGLDKDFTDDLGKRAAGAGGASAGGEGGAAGATAGGATGGTTQAGTGGASGGTTQTGGAAGQPGGGQSGEAGAPAGGAGGAGQAGKGGSSALGGGPAASCPITTFTGLPLCAETGPFPCPGCVCNDVSPATSCGATYKACLTDAPCSQTIECLLRGCSLVECAPLAASSDALVQKFVSCMTNVCPTKCQ